MALNISPNTLTGTIPEIGDLFPVWYQSNVKNARLLRRYSQGSMPPSTKGYWGFVIGLSLASLLLITGILLTAIWLVIKGKELIANFYV